MFGDLTNYRMETLTFEEVGFHGTYHSILGHTCYAKLMVVPNYTYLKLKMPNPCGVIVVGTSFQLAYEFEVECCEHAARLLPLGSSWSSRREPSKRSLTPSGQ
jgi:hypothetical protein